MWKHEKYLHLESLLDFTIFTVEMDFPKPVVDGLGKRRESKSKQKEEDKVIRKLIRKQPQGDKHNQGQKPKETIDSDSDE